MTAMRPGQLPTPDTEAFRHHVAELKAAGLPLTPARLRFLAAAHEFGWFYGSDGFRAMLWDALGTDSPIPPQIRDRRRVEDMRRPASHRAPDRAPEVHVHETRDWWPDFDGLGYTHRCGFHADGFVDSRQTTEMAVAHDNQCPEVRDER